MKKLIFAVSVVAVAAMAALAFAEDEPVIHEISVTKDSDATNVHLKWFSQPGATYRVIQRADLLSTNETSTLVTADEEIGYETPFSTPVPDVPANARGLDGAGPSATTMGFFRLERLPDEVAGVEAGEVADTKGPTFQFVTPAQSASAVSPYSAIQVGIEDAAGVDANSISINFNGETHRIGDGDGTCAWDAEAGIFTFTPDDGVLGDPGMKVAFQVKAKDTAGNETASPISRLTLASDLVAASGAPILVVPATKAVEGTSLRLAATASDSVTFSYADEATSGALQEGALLASDNPANIFYRRVKSVRRDQASGLAVAETENVTLDEFFASGSFDSRETAWTEYDVIEEDDTAAIPDLPPQERHYRLQRVPRPRVSFHANLLSLSNTNYFKGFSISNPNITKYVTLNTTSLGSSVVNANISVAGEFKLIGSQKGLTQCDIIANGSLVVNLNPKIIVKTTSNLSWSTNIDLITPVQKFYWGKIGVVPVGVLIKFTLTGELLAEAWAAGTAEANARLSRSLAYHLHLQDNKWSQIGAGDSGFNWRLNSYQVQGDAKAKVELAVTPRLEADLYGLVGPYLQFRLYAGADADGSYTNYTSVSASGETTTVQDWTYDFRVYGGLSGELGLDGALWNDNWSKFTTWRFLNLEKNFFEKTNKGAPRIVANVKNVLCDLGDTVDLSVQALGMGPLRYYWYRDGQRLTAIYYTNTTCRMVAQTNTVGTYTCVVSNKYGTATSTGSIYAIPSGFVTVPAGTRNVADPDYTNSFTIANAFQIEKTPVTYGRWLDVCEWAETNYYVFAHPGSSKDKNAAHPVQTVSWFDAAKWCNARSQMDGLEPVYLLPGKSDPYIAGDVYPDVNLDATGYRLPTAIEWEAAARGTNLTHRFPLPDATWFTYDSICEDDANFYSCGDSNSVSYHYVWTSYLQGYNPAYAHGMKPYTSPVGDFPPNSYGLYDVIGNVSEWVCDESGQPLTVLGGSWASEPLNPHTGVETDEVLDPHSADYTIGFRCVMKATGSSSE